jgi:hypothetical protein
VRLVELARHEPPEAVVLVRGNEARLELGHFERDSVDPTPSPRLVRTRFFCLGP